jgi:hypothetical protein
MPYNLNLKLMKKLFLSSVIMLSCIAIIFTSCKKDTDTTPDDSSTQTVNGSDDSNFQTESDYALSDADNALSKNSTTQRMSAIPCGITSIDSTHADTLILTYTNEPTCNGLRKRNGTITLALSPAGAKWHQAGVTLTMTFTDYKVTRLSDNKSITFNGSAAITKTEAGTAFTLAIGDSLHHKLRSSNMQVTFDNGTTRAWSVARKRTTIRTTLLTWTVSIAGDTTVGGNTNVAAWGTNRNGNTFYSTIPTPILWSTACLSGPMSGMRLIKGLDRELSITYGLDVSGNAVTSGCPGYYKLNWTNVKGEAKQMVLSY